MADAAASRVARTSCMHIVRVQTTSLHVISSGSVASQLTTSRGDEAASVLTGLASANETRRVTSFASGVAARRRAAVAAVPRGEDVVARLRRAASDDEISSSAMTSRPARDEDVRARLVAHRVARELGAVRVRVRDERLVERE